VVCDAPYGDIDEPVDVADCRSGDQELPVAINLVDLVVVGVGDVYDTPWGDGHVIGGVESAGNRRDVSVIVDFADSVVSGVGDIDVPAFVADNAVGVLEPCGRPPAIDISVVAGTSCEQEDAPVGCDCSFSHSLACGFVDAALVRVGYINVSGIVACHSVHVGARC